MDGIWIYRANRIIYGILGSRSDLPTYGSCSEKLKDARLKYHVARPPGWLWISDAIFFFSNPWWFEGIFLSLQHNSINLKQKRLCGFPVNVAESNSPKIGHGTFAIPVAIVYVPHVLAIIVALTVQASNVVNAPSAIWIGNDICLFTLFLHQKH